MSNPMREDNKCMVDALERVGEALYQQRVLKSLGEDLSLPGLLSNGMHGRCVLRYGQIMLFCGGVVRFHRFSPEFNNTSVL